MNKMIQINTKKLIRNGFTLIELIVVIVIIGILAAIVIPRLAGFSETAQERADLATARTIYSAVASAIAAEDAAALADVDALVTEGYLESAPDGNWTFTGSTRWRPNISRRIGIEP